MNVLVKYEKGTTMSYSLNAYSPYEGFRVVLTGTKGRIEMEVIEAVYTNGSGDSSKEGVVLGKKITVYPMFGDAYEVPIVEGKGGHGGADPIMLNEIFGSDVPKDDLDRAATHIDGAYSIMTGICANKSIASGLPVNIKDIITIPNK